MSSDLCSQNFVKQGAIGNNLSSLLILLRELNGKKSPFDITERGFTMQVAKAKICLAPNQTSRQMLMVTVNEKS